ncbi:MAG TPA: type II toxin-antitoxin system VapC family toxin [Tepidisphaeraceae bacterium]|jgi:predicted nucleic acid-binding protein|nr:type II toxin-antitoxin system VapC family toxin [Tepidisphaeraceae bacterium]
MLTIDASVWVNADSPEEQNSASSREFIDRVKANRIPVVVPMLLKVEVAATIGRATKDAVLAREFAERLTALKLMRWVVLDDVNADVAVKLAGEHGLRGSDAVYAAVALSHQCVLISLDREHLSRMKGVLPVYTPAQAMGMAEIWARK